MLALRHDEVQDNAQVWEGTVLAINAQYDMVRHACPHRAHRHQHVSDRREGVAARRLPVFEGSFTPICSPAGKQRHATALPVALRERLEACAAADPNHPFERTP